MPVSFLCHYNVMLAGLAVLLIYRHWFGYRTLTAVYVCVLLLLLLYTDSHALNVTIKLRVKRKWLK